MILFASSTIVWTGFTGSIVLDHKIYMPTDFWIHVCVSTFKIVGGPKLYFIVKYSDGKLH